MSRYIDADALCEAFTRFVRKANNHDFEPTPNWNDAISIFHSMPLADVAPVVHGEWKLNNLNGFKIYDCSNCGIHMEARWNYCPHCGADMRGENHE